MGRLRKTVFTLALFLFLAGCGGSSDNRTPDPATDCVIGRSTIGECNI